MWTRDEKGKFSAKQHQEMYRLFTEEGLSTKEIANRAGCTRSTVQSSIKKFEKENRPTITKVDFCRQYVEEHPNSSHAECEKAFGGRICRSTFSKAKLEIRKGSSTKDPCAVGTSLVSVDEAEISGQIGYYSWVTKGALGRIGAESYIDRLLTDLKSGAFE